MCACVCVCVCVCARVCARVCVQVGEAREREREEILSRVHAVSSEPNLGLSPTNHEIVT